MCCWIGLVHQAVPDHGDSVIKGEILQCFIAGLDPALQAKCSLTSPLLIKVASQCERVCSAATELSPTPQPGIVHNLSNDSTSALAALLNELHLKVDKLQSIVVTLTHLLTVIAPILGGHFHWTGPRTIVPLHLPTISLSSQQINLMSEDDLLHTSAIAIADDIGAPVPCPLHWTSVPGKWMIAGDGGHSSATLSTAPGNPNVSYTVCKRTHWGSGSHCFPGHWCWFITH